MTSNKSTVPTLSTARYQSDRSGLIEGTDRYKVVVCVNDPDLTAAIERGSAIIPTRNGTSTVVIDTDNPFLRRHRADGEILPDAWGGTMTRDDGSKVDVVKVALRTAKVATSSGGDTPEVTVPDAIAQYIKH